MYRQLLPSSQPRTQIIVEAILDGSAPSTLTLDTLMHELPLDWAAQRAVLNRG